MSATEVLLIAMRWAHGLATVVWLGGGAYATLIQGRRLRELADRAVAAEIGRERTERVTQALSLLFGIEAIVILKDLWGLDVDAAEDVASWAARALIRTAKAEAAEGETAATGPALSEGRTGRPRKKGA